MQNEFPVPVMKIRRNPFVVRPIAATVQSIHIAIARKRKHRVKKKNSCSLETTEAFRNKGAISL